MGTIGGAAWRASQRSAPMWISRLTGVVIALIGGVMFAFALRPGASQAMDAIVIYRIGMPGVLLIGMVGLIAFAFGVHLAVAPRSAVRRWSPGLGRKK